MDRLDRGVAFVSGGSRGIGQAVCVELARRGCRVYTCARDEDALADTAARADGLDGEVIAMSADVTELDSMRRVIERIAEEAGRLDILVNNAGVLGPRAHLEDVDLDQWRRTLRVNIDGVFISSKLSIGLLRAATTPIIINVSSSVGRRGRGGWGPYAVSKHGVEGLTDTFADELAEDDVCVVSLNPGGTATRMRAEAYPDEDPATLPTPEEVAQTFVLLVERLGVEQSGRKYNSRDLMGFVGSEAKAADLPSLTD
jgi:NAD(P)-dependent dehydrogenase (short-subunit alcohol dehydrogenase family)